MSGSVRVRFAPSPTGQVHIGNIRVAIFNWLYARRQGGKFLLRIEDTDLERSTPEAVTALLDVMEWLGMDYDEDAVYQTAQRPRHEQAADRMQNLGMAYLNDDDEPAVVFMLCKQLFDPSFVTEPGDVAEIRTDKAAALRASLRNVVIVDRNPETREEFERPIPWDAIEADLQFFVGGTAVSGAEVRAKVQTAIGADPRFAKEIDLAPIVGGAVERMTFRRRMVFFNDLVLGRREKPLDSLRDFVIIRGDGSPVFHLGNVADDVTMDVTHVLRGNDHVENTFRHLFLFRAMGATPPLFGHFPMIVNDKGKPYSKRDGDAYVGDYRAKGYLPQALFNFLALLGWAPGDDREVMAPAEMVTCFSLDRVSAAPAQMNFEKLEWLNGQYMMKMPAAELMPILKESIRQEGGNPDRFGDAWFAKLVEVMRERLKTIAQFPEKTAYFFQDAVQIDLTDKNVRKVFKKPEARAALAQVGTFLAAHSVWTAENLDAALNSFAEQKSLGMGLIGQPLRVALTGGTVSPGIGDTLELMGRDRTLARIEAALRTVPESLA